MTPRRHPTSRASTQGSSISVVAQQASASPTCLPGGFLGRPWCGRWPSACCSSVADKDSGCCGASDMSLEGYCLDHQSHTCDRQAAIRIWARHPDLTGAGGGSDKRGIGVPATRAAANLLPHRVLECVVESDPVDSLRSHLWPCPCPRPYTPPPSPQPVAGRGLQATGGPEQVWRVLKITHSGCSRAYPAGAGPRVP